MFHFPRAIRLLGAVLLAWTAWGASLSWAQPARAAVPLPMPTPVVPEGPTPSVPRPRLAAEEQTPPRAPAVEGRGIWIEMKTIPRDDAGVRRLLETLARCHFNFLLVEITYEGATLYPSALTSQDPRFVGADPLRVLVEEAHKRGIEVHGWMWVMKQARWRSNGPRPGGPLLALHPDWTAINQDGQAVSPGSSYYWLCPSRPDARELLLTMMEEAVTRYPLDGLHLDYIRFERALVKGSPPPYCFCDHCRKEYQRGAGIDPIAIQPFTPAFNAWEAWRENLINSLVAEASVRVKARRPNALLSAAVYPSPENARHYFGQDWGLWARNRWLDFAAPMLYRDYSDEFLRRLEQYARSGLTHQIVVLPGVGVNEIQNRIFSHDVLIEQVLGARRQGMPGMTLFSYSVMTPYLEEFLIDKAYPQPATVPFRDPAAAAAQLLAQAETLSPQTAQVAADPAVPMGDPRRQINWLKARAQELQDVAAFRCSAMPLQPASAPQLDIEPGFRPPPSLRVFQVDPDDAPRIDGGLSDEAWKKVPAIPLRLDANGSKATLWTWVKLATDGQSLYAAFHCREPEMKRLVQETRRPTRSIFEVDNVALFLDPGPSRSQYLVLAVDALGRRGFEKVPSGRHRPPGVETPENVPDSLTWSAAAKRGKDAWSVEMSIPLDRLFGARKPGPLRLGLNLQRAHRAARKRQYFQWSPTYGPPYAAYRFGTADLQK